MSKRPQSGVDIDLGNQCSRTAYAWAKKSFSNRPAGEGNPMLNVEGSFSNIMDFHGVKIGMSSDGIGTKIEVAERTGIYDTLGYDLIAMTADDLAANGMETVNMTNILDVDHLDHAIVDTLMRGLHDAAKFAKVVITGGEIAELGDRIGGYGPKMHFNWCAAGISILPEGQTPIDGADIRPGDAVIALKSRGFRSNGYSLLRRIMEDAFGDAWHLEPYGDTTWGKVLLTPSLIYSPLVSAIRRQKFALKGISHITGGGLGDNFARVLKVAGFGAALTDIYEPLPVMLDVQRIGKVPEARAYRLWNMGNGMLLAVNADEAPAIVRFAAEQGFAAKICGSVIPEAEIRIDTKANDPQALTYKVEG
ncbi:MAG: phosphoribosylformylglycinamidine cyclo-ligase [Candidatus Marinimicrobia bacterium]|nr:phosphoribosylformylglycinamidine cyclo-ligase [Candidatus Neomarinimicrobiota bacterium]